MILVGNQGSFVDFGKLCKKAEENLNRQARQHKVFKGGTGLEKDVYDALLAVAQGTEFAKETIKLVSGLKFPDITIGDHYGVEVKSNNSSWRSVGGSVLEASRIEGIERIYLMYGKLRDPVTFMTRPYEECLYDVSVTHSPRYLIDMTLKPGETIFAQMNTTYEEIRKSEDPISQLLAFKKKKHPEGNSWWSQEASFANSSSPFLLQFFHNLDRKLKQRLVAEGFLLFPQILTTNPNKFESVSLYWLQVHSVMCRNIRDAFTSGGKVQMKIGGRQLLVPHIFQTIVDSKEEMLSLIQSLPAEVFVQHWGNFIKSSGFLTTLVAKKENLKLLELWQQIVLSQSNLIFEEGTFRDFLQEEFDDVKDKSFDQ